MCVLHTLQMDTHECTPALHAPHTHHIERTSLALGSECFRSSDFRTETRTSSGVEGRSSEEEPTDSADDSGCTRKGVGLECVVEPPRPDMKRIVR